MTLISKNVYINKLDDIVKKYNNTYHSTIKMKHRTHILTLVKKLKKKIVNLKLVILSEYQNIKIFLQEATLQIRLKKLLWLIKLKIHCRGHMLLMILTGKKFLGIFAKNELQKRIRKSLELKK